MIIVAGGDSFTFGAELADQVGFEPSNSTTPALLAKSIGASYHCAAKNGNSNDAISRMVINACESIRGEQLFVYVLWTFTCRYEFCFNYNIGRSPWYSITPWDNHADMNEITRYVWGDKKILDQHKRHMEYTQNSGLGDFSKTFFKHVGDNMVYETYSTMKEVVYLQNYLKNKSVPYLFTFADNSIHPENTKFSEDMYKDVSITSVRSQIEWDRCFMYPSGTGMNQTEHPRGFYQWAMENKYPVGTTHPLEQAHIDAANLMQEKFNEMVKKSVQ